MSPPGAGLTSESQLVRLRGIVWGVGPGSITISTEQTTSMSNVAKLNQDLEAHKSNQRQAKAHKLKGDKDKTKKAVKGKRIPRTNEAIARRAAGDKRPDVSSSEFAYWLRSLEYPSRYPEPICPVGFNPVPSLFKTTARTFKTMLQFSVAAGTQTSIYLYPGHGTNRFLFNGVPAGGDVVPTSMDGVSYHGSFQSLNSILYSVGPFQVYTGVTPIGGCMQSNAAIGSIASSNTDLSSYSPLGYDKPLPYSTASNADTAAHGGHARWQQTSARIKVVNTTPIQSRGGSVITVMPMNGGQIPDSAGAVSQMAANPSFFDHGPSMKADGEGVSWLPRPQDIAFWHALTGNNIKPNTTLAGVGLCCFISAPGIAAQTYDIQIDWNWMLSGDFLQGISTPNPTRNEHLQPVATALQIMQEGAKSAVGFSGVHAAVANADWKAAGATVFNVAKNAIKEGFKSLA
jgi:hypothetical protein